MLFPRARQLVRWMHLCKSPGQRHDNANIMTTLPRVNCLLARFRSFSAWPRIRARSSTFPDTRTLSSFCATDGAAISSLCSDFQIVLHVHCGASSL